ncbi:MAG: hypothetical protein GY832_31715 [Chloroflexi bacterium]|nr:hypothetical protein [Chloroflexota bacterium]
MRTARIMVTTECDRMCPYCCSHNGNPAFQSCKLVRNLGEIPPHYDAYAISGGEPYGSGHQAAETTRHIRWLRMCRLKPIYLYTSVYHGDIPFNVLDGITYTLHYPLTSVDRDDLWRIQERVTRYGAHRPNMRLIINKDIRPGRIPHINMGAWDEIRRSKFDPDGICPLGGGEDLYLMRG